MIYSSKTKLTINNSIIAMISRNIELNFDPNSSEFLDI